MEARLTYSQSRGLAEKIRLMLCLADIQFQDNFMKNRQDFLKLVNDGELLFDQLPLLEIDGLKLVQSGAIMRYLAAKANMYGSNPQEQVKIDMYYESAQDFNRPLASASFYESEEICKDKAMQIIPKYFSKFEKILKENGTGYLVGNALTLADVGLLEAVLNIEDFLGNDPFTGYPFIQKFNDKFASDPRVQFYKKNHRQEKLTAERIKEIKEIYNIC